MTTNAGSMLDTEPIVRWPGGRRVQAFAGELRVNLVRLVAIVLFYVHNAWSRPAGKGPGILRVGVDVNAVASFGWPINRSCECGGIRDVYSCPWR